MANIRLEIIYYQTGSDFEMEFRLAGVCRLRILTAKANTPRELVTALSRAVSRNRVIMVVGKLDGELAVCDLISKAIQKPLCNCSCDECELAEGVQFLAPEGATPLITESGNAAGCLMDNGAQTIILLTDDKQNRTQIMKNLIHPYISDLSQISNNSKSDTTAPIIVAPVEAVDDEQEEIINNEDIVVVDETIDTNVAVAIADTVESEEVEAEQEDDIDKADDEYFIQNGIFEQDEPQKPKSKKGYYIFGALLLALILIVVGVFGYFKAFMPLRAKSVYAAALQSLGENNAELPDSALKKFGALYSENNNIAGWISIGGTNISLPVVSSNNDYYKSHLYNNEYNLCGTPYIKQAINSETYMRNTVIYTSGNWVSNNFAELFSYSDLEFYRSAPIITFDTLYTESTWKIFSIFTHNTGSAPLDYEKTAFFDDSEFASHINALAATSKIVTTVTLSADDDIITLINQTDDGKTAVVVARKTKIGENVGVDTDGAVKIESFNGVTGISSTPEITSSAPPVSSSPVTEIISSAPVSSKKPAVSSKKPVSSKPADEPLSDEEIKENLENLKPITPPPVSSKPVASTPQAPTTPTIPSDNGWLPLTATRQSDGAKISGTAIEIISQICAAEVGTSYEVEAIKAQAVAAYNWMLCNGGASGKYPSVPMKNTTQKITNAVASVAGKAIYYNGGIANVYYYAYSAGVTSNVYDIWGSQITTSTPYPYLTTVDSSVDKNHKNFQTMRTYKASDIANWVKESANVDLSGISDKTKWFNLTYANGGTSPYVAYLTFGNDSTKYKGPYLRNTIFTASRVKAAGYGSSYVLKSSAYTITYNPLDDTFTFTVKGYGHGVGMSQYGANQYALSGWNYIQILTHYYKGLEVR